MCDDRNTLARHNLYLPHSYFNACCLLMGLNTIPSPTNRGGVNISPFPAFLPHGARPGRPNAQNKPVEGQMLGHPLAKTGSLLYSSERMPYPGGTSRVYYPSQPQQSWRRSACFAPLSLPPKPPNLPSHLPHYPSAPPITGGGGRRKTSHFTPRSARRPGRPNHHAQSIPTIHIDPSHKADNSFSILATTALMEL